jgi:integrase
MQTNKLLTMPKPKTTKKSRKPSLRVRGQGSPFLRGETFWMELNWKGERYRRSLETTDRETALIKLDAEVAAIRAGELPKKFDPITCQTMFDAFMVRAEVDCKPETIRNYKQRWTLHLKQTFGSLVATQVTKDTIVAYLNRRKRDGASLPSRNREQRILQMIFNFNRGKIPADRFPEFPKMASELGHVRRGRLSNDDYKIVVERIEKRIQDAKEYWLKVYITMVFKYGFRRNELLHAKVGYFDPKTAKFAIPAYAAKTKRERVVKLKAGGDIYKMLVALIGDRAADAPLFTRDGKPVKDFRIVWASLTEGIRGGSGKNGTVTIHDLRRSAITNMSEKGITAAQAGTHLTTEIFHRYISRSEEEQEQTARLIEDD